MAVVLIWRPWGLLGQPQGAVRSSAAIDTPLRPLGAPARRALFALAAVLLLVPLAGRSLHRYAPVLLIDILIAVLFAASLHFIMGPGGMHSFGHAAYFGLGAYGAALLAHAAGAADGARAVARAAGRARRRAAVRLVRVRLSGVYLAMLTLAFAQIVWSVVFQWDEFTGGSNGLIGVWPSERFASTRPRTST